MRDSPAREGADWAMEPALEPLRPAAPEPAVAAGALPGGDLTESAQAPGGDLTESAQAAARRAASGPRPRPSRARRAPTAAPLPGGGRAEAASRVAPRSARADGAATAPAQAIRTGGMGLASRDLPRALARAAGRGLLFLAVFAFRSPRCRAAFSVLVFLAALAAGSDVVRSRVEADTRYRVSKASLAATAPPPGLARDAVQDLAAIPIPGRSFSLYRPDAIATIAATYAALPWVREVRSIEKLYPAVIRFDLVVRRPVAGLEHQGTTYLIDEEGLVLPRRCYEPNDPAALKLPTIVRAKLGRRPIREGERLEDVPVRHGIAVALALEAEAFDPLRNLPTTIDVSNVNFEVALNRPEVVVTAGGTVIEWGRSEASPGFNIPLEEKIANFSEALKKRPLDRLSLVRLQFDRVEWRERPLAPAPRVE